MQRTAGRQASLDSSTVGKPSRAGIGEACMIHQGILTSRVPCFRKWNASDLLRKRPHLEATVALLRAEGAAEPALEVKVALR